MTPTQSILLVEDAPDFQILVKATLKDLPVKIETAISCEQALQALRSGKKFDLVLLDVSLPDGDGFSLCERIRQEPSLKQLPVIFLTGRQEIEDKVRGFSLGAEDYILKPLEPVEFKARLKARLTNLQARREDHQLARGPVRIDYSLQKAFVSEGKEERDLQLTPAEFRILAFLMSHDGQVFAGKELLRAIWGEDVHVVDHNLYTHIYALRKKLGEHSKAIESMPRGGYRFNA